MWLLLLFYASIKINDFHFSLGVLFWSWVGNIMGDQILLIILLWDITDPFNIMQTLHFQTQLTICEFYCCQS